MPSFYEFFAGGGMARAGLGDKWRCLFANDIDARKAASYARNWGNKHLRVEDVAALTTEDLPGCPDLVWASFPCQDLSLAGSYAGLRGERSGTFWPFWRLMKSLAKEGRAPAAIVLENVCGALTSHRGEDFAAIGSALAREGYRFGAVVIDAVHFLPQSRPRLFVIAVSEKLPLAGALGESGARTRWHPANLTTAYERLSSESKEAWVWWDLPMPAPRQTTFADILEENPDGVSWHTAAETKRLLDLMSSLHREKVEKAKMAERRMVGAIYKRTRMDETGARKQRAEVRFDDVAGCLRTPVGGSSRQSILIVEGNTVRSRLLSPREAARLMGLPDTYKLPMNYNEAYHLAGDGVAVPVVRHLAAHVLEPLFATIAADDQEAA